MLPIHYGIKVSQAFIMKGSCIDVRRLIAPRYVHKAKREGRPEIVPMRLLLNKRTRKKI